MSVKNFTLFVLLGFSGLLNAELPANISPAPIESPCNLPAPINFQVVNTGSTWVDLTWIPSSQGSAHRIKTYETSTGNLVSNILVQSGVLVQRVNGLQPNTGYNSTINAVCEDGSDSDLYEYINFQTVILELIVIGRQPGASIVNCTIQAPGGMCSFPIDGSETAFMIQSVINPELIRKFTVMKHVGMDRFRTGLRNGNNFENYAFQVDHTDPDFAGIGYQIKFLGQTIAEYELFAQNNQNLGWLNCTYLSPDYRLLRLALNSGSGGGTNFNGGSIGTLEESNTLVASTMPNPFSDQLNVQLEQFSEAPIQLSLFNLNGQRVLDQSFTGGSETYTLNTAHIPAGFYLLRVDYNSEVQTVKVVKMQ